MIDRLEREGRRFSFFQIVQLLLREQDGAEAPGGVAAPSTERIRFRPALSLAFAATDVDRVERDGNGRVMITINFLGLYGPASPLPNHFAEDLLQDGADAQPVRDFLDVFHHRVISLFYRSWEKYRHPLGYQRDGADPFSRRMLCLLGLGTSGMEPALGLPLAPLLKTAGALAERRRSAAGLEGFLRAHVPGIEVRVEPCVARRAAIPERQRLLLGGRAGRLGVEACLGETVPDRAGKFRVALGPLACEDYRRFLPGREALARLVRLTRLYVSEPLELEVVLSLRRGDAPAARLGGEDELPLGQMTWLSPPSGLEGRAALGEAMLRSPPARMALRPAMAAAIATPMTTRRT